MAREGEVYPKRSQMEKKTKAPVTPTRQLSGDSVPSSVMITAATRGGNGSHSRGGMGPIRKDTSTGKKKRRRKPSGSRFQVPHMANHGTKIGVLTPTPRHGRTILASSVFCCFFFLKYRLRLFLCTDRGWGDLFFPVLSGV